MKKKKHPALDGGIQIETNYKLTIKKPDRSATEMGNHSSNLYDSSTIDTETAPYNTLTPGVSQFDKTNKSTSPALLAIGSKTRKVRSSFGPSVIKPSFNNTKIPLSKDLNSLLSKKPLSDLQDNKKNKPTQIQQQNEIEKMGIMFKDDPFAYFVKHREGLGHQFIYLKYAKNRKDPSFSPYDLTKTVFCEAGENYFTMSAKAITHVDELGNTETCSLDDWTREEMNFSSIRQLRTFRTYLFWKPFRVWRTCVRRQRYKQVLQRSRQIPSLSNFFIARSKSSMSVLTQQIDKIMVQSVLGLIARSNYTIKEFRDAIKANTENLKVQYQAFLNTAIEKVTELYEILKDPSKLLVDEGDFDEIKRKNPNITTLIFLEQKKEEQRLKQTEKVQEELTYLPSFVRMTDYMFIEHILDGLFKAWNFANENIKDDSSAVFSVEISFDDYGNVSFIPDKETLIKCVIDSLDENLRAIEELPRILFVSEIKKMNLKFDEYPVFSEIFSSLPYINKTKGEIVEVFNRSYESAIQSSQSFHDFYPLYKLSQEWDVKNYIKTPSGKLYKGSILNNERDENEEFDSFLINYNSEPIVDISEIRIDIRKLIHENERVDTIRNSYISGAIFLDSYPLKRKLKPIPTQFLNEIEKMLTELIQLKIKQLNNAFKMYSLNLKVECKNLEIFVNFCSLIKKIQKLMPKMNSIIAFVDDVVSLFEQSRFHQLTNPLHESFDLFKDEFQSFLQIKDSHYNSYASELKLLNGKIRHKIEKYYRKSQLIPKHIPEFNYESFSKRTTELKAKIKKIKSSIHQCIEFQSILEVDLPDFEQYKESKLYVQISENILILYKQYEEAIKYVNKIPFDQVDIDSFRSKLNELADQIAKIDLLLNGKTCSLYREITKSYMEFSPYIDEFSILSNGKLQRRHWNQLFEECGKKGCYNDQITIENLISLNIIGNIERIKKITRISLGEYELDEEIKEISNKWSEVHIPLAHVQAKTDMTLFLAPLDNLLNDINDTTIKLRRILDSPFVGGIRQEVEKLTTMMDKIIDICKAWQIFQGNWITVSTLYQQEAVFKAIPHQQQRFSIVKRKWSAIVRHVWSNTRLFAVCQFQSLLEDLQDNSRDLEIILKDLVLYVNTKRDLLPRLYFLSDHELLTMNSTTSFSTFSSLFLKTMMYISRLDSHSKDAAQLTNQDSTKELCNFSGLTIFSIVGEDGDCLPLANHILCTGPFESWAPSIFDSIEESFKDHLKESFENYQSNNLEDFILSNSSYLGFLVLSSVFTNNVDDCFNRLETNQRAFLIYEQQLIEKVNQLINSLGSPFSSTELLKISNAITLINMFIERIHSYQDKVQNYSFKLKWRSVLKHRYNPTTETLFCEFADYQIPHGLEYWGNCPRLIISPEIDSNMINIGESVSSFGIPMLYGPFKSGKSTLMKSYALMFGHYFYKVQPFPDMSKYLIDQLLIGAMESNSWIYFHNIHELKYEKIEYLFDQLRNLTSEQISKHTEYQYNKTRKIKISQTTRFFLSKTIESEIPPPLRSFSRPISLRTPSFTKLIEIQLLSTGYKSSKYIAPKLNGFLNSVTTILKLHLSTLSYAIKIMNDGYDYLKQMIHKNRCTFINYYSESRTAEEYSIAIGCYSNMKYSLDEDELEILIQMIYSYFTLFDEYWMFKSYIQKPNCFVIDRLESIIQSFLYKRIPELKIDLPTEYLISKVVDLFKLLRNHTTVCVFGPPSTGKSIIIQLLFESIDVLSKEKDSALMPGILPIKEARCFNGSGSWVDEFGLFEYTKNIEKENGFYLNNNFIKIKQKQKQNEQQQELLENLDLVSGESKFKAKNSKHKFINGEIMSAMKFLSRYEGTHHRVLYLDGPIDLKLSNFLIDATIDSSKVQFTTLDSYKTNKSFHIILETENINDVSPSFMAVCGVLPTKTCQFLYTPLHSALELDIIHPIIPFSTASLKYSNLLTDEKISLIRSLFCDILPNVIRQVQIIPNQIDVFSVCSQYSTYAAELTLAEIIESNCDIDEELYKISVIFGLFRVFSPIMVQSQILSFDEFLRRTFSIKLPDEWVGFGLPNSYWNAFPTPSALSMRLWNKKLNPHKISILNSPPIKNGHSITVIVPQYLPNLTTFQLGLRSGQHFLITGEQYSGKQSFINVCLNQFPNIIPVHFYLTPLTVSRDLRDVILKQSQIVTSECKNGSDPIRFALIFHHLDGCKLEVFEFIRMLIKLKTLPKLSNYDPKVYDVINLDKFIVIATGINISSYPIRFLSLFTPLLMQNYIQSTKDYIITKFMENESITDKFITLVCYSLNELNLTLGKMLRIIKVICMMPERSSEKDIVKMLIVFMTEVQHTSFYDDTEGFKNYENEVFQICQGLELAEVFQSYRTEKKLLIPRIYSNNKLELVTINFNELKESLSKLSGRKFTNHEVKQYIYVSHSISRIKSHCEICGPTSTGKMSLIKLYSQRNKIKMIDISYVNQEILKSSLVKVILTNKQKLIVLRVTKDTQQILPLLYTLIVRKNYKLIFDEDEIEELYRNISMTDRPSEIQRRDADLTILKNIDNNCHLILITESEINLPNIELIKIKCDSKLHICDEILTEDFVSMKSLFCKIADKVSEILPYSHQNQFYDLINLFAETIKLEEKNLKIRNSKIQLALSFYNKIYNENNNASMKTNELKPLVTQLKEETKKIREDLKTKKEFVTEKKNKLNEELMLILAKLNQKKQEFNDADVALQLNIPKFEFEKQRILSLNDQDIQSLRIFAAAPTPFVKKLSEICCVVTNRPRNNKKIFSEENLKDILTGEESDYNLLEDKKISELKKLLNSEIILDQKQVESAPPVVSIIISYFKLFYQMAHQSNVCKSKKELVESCRKSLDEYNEYMSKEQQMIKEIESTFSTLSKELEEKQAKLEEMKVEYKQIKTEKRVMDSILKDSNTLINEWKYSSEEFQNLLNSLIGDTIIWASYVIYAGMLHADRRTKLIDCVHDILISENIPVSFDNPLDYIEKKLYTTKMPVDIDITSLPQSLLLDFHHLAISVRVPLVIDLDGLVLNCLKTSNKFVEVSLNSLSFIKVASEVFQSNKYLAVTDADRLTPVLMQIINGNKVIQFEDSKITRNPEFKLFLFTNNTKIYDFDPDLMSRVSVIDTTKSSLEGVKSKIIYSFLDYFDPDLIPRLKQIEKIEISQKEEMNKYENESLDAFSKISEKDQEDGEYSYLKDEDLVPVFVKAKDYYMTYNIQTDTNNKVRKEFELALNQYQNLIDVCFNFWHILTRYIRKISPSIIRLNDYLSTISTAFTNSGLHTLNNEQNRIFKSNLINSLYQLIFPSLSYNEILTFVFLTAFFNKKIDESEFDKITEHISSEYDSKVLFDTIDLDRIGSTFDYLKYSSVDHFFKLIYRFICDELGRDFLNYLPLFNIDNALSSQIVILYSDGDKEPTELLCQFVTIRNLKEFFVMISLNKSTIKQTRKLILRGMNEGLWIAVNYSKVSIESSLLLNEIPSLMKMKSRIHENFKLILNCRTTEFLSLELIKNSRFFRINNFPSIRGTLQEIYYHHSASLKLLDYSSAAKKMTYLSALIFVQIQYRNFLRPCGFNFLFPLSACSFDRVIHVIGKLVELNEIPIFNFRDFLELSFFSSSVIEESDRLKLKNIVASFITSNSLDDGFNFLSNDSTELDRWLIPNKSSLPNYMQFISKLPSFEDSDILGMEKTPADGLLQWNLSRYFSLTFKKLYECSQSLLSKDSNFGNYHRSNSNFNQSVERTEEEYENYRQRIISQIPTKITSFEMSSEVSPVVQFWLNEANAMNRFIDEVNDDLIVKKIKIYEGMVPEKWHKYKPVRQMSRFLTYLNDKRSFILQYLQKSEEIVDEIDISYITNVRAFFNAYLANYAYRKKINVSSLYYDFSFGEGNEHQSIVITNLTMMNGKIENNCLVQSTMPFNKLPKLFCRISKKNSNLISSSPSKSSIFFACPVYKFVFDPNLKSTKNEMLNNEIVDNFVLEIPIQSEVPEKVWIMNGTSIYCNLPTQFVPV